LEAPVVGLDAYYRDLADMPLDARALANFDTPDSLDETLLTRQIQLLAQGRTVDLPVYDFTRHVRSDAVQRIQPSRCLIVEGLFTLHWEAVRNALRLKIFVEAEDSVCLARRIERDVRERGRTRESVLQQYEATVRPMAEAYVLPCRQHADLVLDGTSPIESSVTAVLSRIR
jgi:uridine kinase